MRIALLVVLLVAATPAFAGNVRPLVGAVVQGDTKVTEETVLRLAHVAIGDPVTAEMAPQFAAALVSSELFKQVDVHLEEGPGGYALVAKLVDKLSWIVAPTIYVLPASWSFGVGYAENDLFGEEKKLLLYGQLGTRTNMFFGTYFDPAFHGTALMLRFDVYALHRSIDEYANPTSDETDFSLARTTTWNFVDIGLLVGWRFRWWLSADVRFKPGYAWFRDVKSDDAALAVTPERDGWDNTVQGRVTVDHRAHRHGVTWGSYAQLYLEASLPGIDDYGYQLAAFRTYYSWRFFAEHQLEVRGGAGIGRHLPLHEELVIGGVSDVRGYIGDQFRGDRRAWGRVEYSVPLASWRTLAFRGIGFYDVGTIAYGWRDPSSRVYLPTTQANGAQYTRSDVGAGFRVYVGSVVLPLLGIDVAYGLEGKHPEVVFELGLTDF